MHMFGAALVASQTTPVHAFPGTCGLDSTQDPDCQRGDAGSCGGACCKVEVSFAATAKQLAASMQSTFAAGGADGAFKPATTWGDFFNLTDGCRQLDPAETTDTYLCQAVHTTSGGSGGYHFNDTINALIGPSEGAAAATVVTFFSISQIAGALGDAGQNWKNIALVRSAIAHPEATKPKALLGCPKPKGQGVEEERHVEA